MRPTLDSLMPFLLILCIHFPADVFSQSPAPAPGPPPPTNITAILEKAGRFTTLIRLMQSNKLDDRLNNQLNNSDQGLTLFAPSDAAFSSLKAGTLNSYTDQQKVQLIQFHTLPTFFSLSQFQTASNPLTTQAGGGNGQFPLNITTSGNQVNITTGIVNATVANTVYTDNELAIYEVDQVLLPRDFFFPPSPPPAQAPSPAKSKKRGSSSDSSSDSNEADASSSSTGISPMHFLLNGLTSMALIIVAVVLSV